MPVFGALCFFLSAVEFVIPKPLPFLRIGLANVPLMLALDVLPFRSFLLLACIKIIGQAVISGTLFSYLVLFSAAGTLGAALMMYSLRGISRKVISFAGISIAGAFVSNMLQLCIGRFFIFGKGIWYMVPPFLCIGAVSALLLGIFCEKFTAESEWYAQITAGKLCAPVQPVEDYMHAEHPLFRFFAGLLLLTLLFFSKTLPIQLSILGAALILCLAEKQKIHPVTMILSSLGIIVCHSFIPIGRELISIGSFSLTSGALLNGLEKAVFLQSMIFISRWIIQIRIPLPGMIGKTLEASLYIFKHLLKFKERVRLRNIITGVDELLLSIPYMVQQEANL